MVGKFSHPSFKLIEDCDPVLDLISCFVEYLHKDELTAFKNHIENLSKLDKEKIFYYMFLKFLQKKCENTTPKNIDFINYIEEEKNKYSEQIERTPQSLFSDDFYDRCDSPILLKLALKNNQDAKVALSLLYDYFYNYSDKDSCNYLDKVITFVAKKSSKDECEKLRDLIIKAIEEKSFSENFKIILLRYLKGLLPYLEDNYDYNPVLLPYLSHSSMNIRTTANQIICWQIMGKKKKYEAPSLAGVHGLFFNWMAHQSKRLDPVVEPIKPPVLESTESLGQSGKLR